MLLALNLFLLLAAYYMLKTVREALILTQGGAEVKTYSAAGQAILVFLDADEFTVSIAESLGDTVCDFFIGGDETKALGFHFDDFVFN